MKVVHNFPLLASTEEQGRKLAEAKEERRLEQSLAKVLKHLFIINLVISIGHSRFEGSGLIIKHCQIKCQQRLVLQVPGHCCALDSHQHSPRALSPAVDSGASGPEEEAKWELLGMKSRMVL